MRSLIYIKIKYITSTSKAEGLILFQKLKNELEN